jgi:hypothetical protein
MGDIRPVQYVVFTPRRRHVFRLSNMIDLISLYKILRLPIPLLFNRTMIERDCGDSTSLNYTRPAENEGNPLHHRKHAPLPSRTPSTSTTSTRQHTEEGHVAINKGNRVHCHRSRKECTGGSSDASR